MSAGQSWKKKSAELGDSFVRAELWNENILEGKVAIADGNGEPETQQVSEMAYGRCGKAGATRELGREGCAFYKTGGLAQLNELRG